VGLEGGRQRELTDKEGAADCAIPVAVQAEGRVSARGTWRRRRGRGGRRERERGGRTTLRASQEAVAGGAWPGTPSCAAWCERTRMRRTMSRSLSPRRPWSATARSSRSSRAPCSLRELRLGCALRPAPPAQTRTSAAASRPRPLLQQQHGRRLVAASSSSAQTPSRATSSPSCTRREQVRPSAPLHPLRSPLLTSLLPPQQTSSTRSPSSSRPTSARAGGSSTSIGVRSFLLPSAKPIHDP